MGLKLFSGTANPGLAKSIAQNLSLILSKARVHFYPDGELSVEVEENVQGQDVYLLQPTSPPVADNLLELLLLVDTVNRAGARKISAIVPYFGYARQDRRVTGMEPIGARLIAGLFESTALSRMIVVDLHNPAVAGFFKIPLENISAVPLLAEAARKARADVVVSPDLGAIKLAEHYGRLLDLPVAIVHKGRISSTEVKVHAVVGEIKNKKPLIVDDMISTAGTVEAAAQALLAEDCIPEISVAATHGLLVDPASQRLKNLPIKHIFLTNSIQKRPETGLSIETVNLGPLLADLIKRLNNQESIIDLLAHL
jgi:ribose-phosphate pyrophosphokinase